MNRREQLEKTLAHNLEVVGAFDGAVELCLVNFIKDEEGKKIDQWVQQFAGATGFSYFVSSDLPRWNASIAKNTAHVASRGTYLVNLDGDNFMSLEEIRTFLAYPDKTLRKLIYSGFRGGYIREERKGLHKLVSRLKSRYLYRTSDPEGRAGHDGTYGRLGMSRQCFMAINGYDESLPPGGEDKDLFVRVQGVYPTHRLLHIPSVLPAILNDKAVGLENTDQAGQNWDALNAQSMKIIEEKWQTRQFVANQGGLSIGVPVINGFR